MKKLVVLLVLLGTAVSAFVLLERSGPEDVRKVEGLPWQIEELPGGLSRVFGVTLDRSTLGEAGQILGGNGEVAILVNEDQNYGLEMFFSRYTAGVFSGKLILVADLAAEELEPLVQRAVKRKYLESGGKKYTPAPQDMPAILGATVRSITFLPTVSLDEQTAYDRFGIPEQTLVVNEQQVHLLYPRKGLDIIINRKGREVLQYVAPKSFAALRDPLEP